MFLIEEFSFGNFKSFKEIQTLRMSKANIKSSNESLDENNIIEIEGKGELLKSKVIYGANASGKSNVIKALMTFCDIILKCLSEGKSVSALDQFLFSERTTGEPCFFQLIFYINNTKYRYGFESDWKKIHDEWLYITHQRETPVFVREGQKVSVTKSHMTVGYEIANMKSKLFTEKSLFLSVTDSFSDNLANNIVENIRKFIDINTSNEKNRNDFLDNKSLKEKIVDLLKYADIGIADLDFLGIENGDKENVEKEKYLLGVHKKYNENLEETGKVMTLFDYMESEGTKEMLNSSLSIIKALELGIPLVIDEFGAKLHPLLTKKILSLFNSKENKHSQLIVVTHTTELMSPDLLRRDQIDFVEKDKYGRSYLYTLIELKGIRDKAYFEKDYLQGKYGAIPFLGNWDNFCKIEDNTIED